MRRSFDSKAETFIYENILQYICKHDLTNALVAYLDSSNFTFARTPLSPMLFVKMLTGDILMKHLSKEDFHLRDRTRIVKGTTSEEFKKIIKLDGLAIKIFFDIASQPLRYFPKHNPFQGRLTAQLKPQPYFLLAD
jgi:hypothetical protein